MQESNSSLETWLQEIGGPAYDRSLADPSTAIPIDDVIKNLDARRRELPSEEPKETISVLA